MIGIVTVMYNCEKVLDIFFQSLSLQSYKQFILYIIDNQSPDKALIRSKQLASTCGFKTVIIENGQNDGVARGNNIGIQKALDDGCDMVLLSNNDIMIEPDAIEALLDGLNMHGSSMAVPKIYYYGTTRFWAAGGYFNKWTGLNQHTGDGQIDIGQYNVARSISYAATCFMLIRKEVFEHVGLMDEHYFVYWDDVDFVYKALKKGETLWYIPTSLVHHNESTSTGFMSDFSVRYLYRNLVYFALKNYSLPYAAYVLLLNIGYHTMVLAFKWPFNKWELSMKAYKEGFDLYRSLKKGLRKDFLI